MTAEFPQTGAGPAVTGFFHPATGSVAYVVADPAMRRAAVIDAVLDLDPASGRTDTGFADTMCRHVEAQGLAVDWVLETHAHADHLSAAPHVRSRLGGHTGIGAHIRTVQRALAPLYGMEVPTAEGFDHLFADGERFALGSLDVSVMHTPGHTPACVSYHVGDAVFCGDTLFMPDYGTARCDFPGGDAAVLYRSIRRLLALPAATRLFTAHDYQPGGRPAAWASTVGQQRACNRHIRDGVSETEFVAMRRTRDATLSRPALMWAAVQVNIQAGRLPQPEANGIAYLKLPLNVAARN